MNITQKKYKKLALLVSLNGFSFCCFDTLQKKIISYNEVFFDTQNKSTKIEELFANAFKSFEELNEIYDEIVVIHSNNLSTFVPVALFEEKYLGSYLQYNVRVFKTDSFAFDSVSNYEMNTVYIPYIHINNFFIDTFGSFDYKHATTILIAKVLESSKNNDNKKMVVHFNSKHFEIIVVQNQQLLLFNSFDYTTPEDFLYYILFVAEQLNLNPEKFLLEFVGNINKENPCYKLAYQYIRNISFFDVSNLQRNNSFSESINRQHFILFNS